MKDELFVGNSPQLPEGSNRLYLVSPELGTDAHMVEAKTDKEAVEKYVKQFGVPQYPGDGRFKAMIVRYVSDVISTYRVEIVESMPQPHPSYKEDALS